MCVIIDRQPGVTIPIDKLASACDNNPHGFGLMFHAPDGSVGVFRHFDPKGNDPEFIQTKLKEYEDRRVALHLRFRTHGDADLLNCHPYDVFECASNERGLEMYMMHNGVLGGYTANTDKRSDSFVFIQKFVRPLLENNLHVKRDISDVLDPTNKMLIDKECGTNRLLFVDNAGNWWRSSEDQWVKYDGWDASNNYYFGLNKRRTTYYTPPTRSYYSSRPHTEPNVWSRGERKALKTLHRANGGTKNANTAPWEDQEEAPSYVEEMGLNHISEVIGYTKDDLEELVAFYPDKAVLLLQALILELYEVEIEDEVDEDEDTDDELLHGLH